jgi:hypothetical protein
MGEQTMSPELQQRTDRYIEALVKLPAEQQAEHLLFMATVLESLIINMSPDEIRARLTGRGADGK